MTPAISEGVLLALTYPITPPVATRIPYISTNHGTIYVMNLAYERRIDCYFGKLTTIGAFSSRLSSSPFSSPCAPVSSAHRSCHWRDEAPRTAACCVSDPAM